MGPPKRYQSDPSSIEGSTPIAQRESKDINDRYGEVSFSILAPSPVKLNSTFFFGTKINDTSKQS